MFFRLPALVARRYCGAVSLSYKKVPEACSPGYENVPKAGSPGYSNVPRAGSPGYLKGPRAGSPGHIFVPRAGSPRYIGLADYRLKPVQYNSDLKLKSPSQGRGTDLNI